MTPNPTPVALLACAADASLPAIDALTARFAELFPRVAQQLLTLEAGADGSISATYDQSKAEITFSDDAAPTAMGDVARLCRIIGTAHPDTNEGPAELCLLVSLLAASLASLGTGDKVLWAGIDQMSDGALFVRGMQNVFNGALPVELWLHFPAEQRDDGRYTMRTSGLDVFTGGWELSSDFAHPKLDWLQHRFASIAAMVMQTGVPEPGRKVTVKQAGKVALDVDEANKLILLDPSRTKGAKGKFGLAS